MWSSNDKKAGALGGDENFTFLGKGVDFKGIVHFEGTVRIDGRLEGEVHTKGTLVVGELATIKLEVRIVQPVAHERFFASSF